MKCIYNSLLTFMLFTSLWFYDILMRVTNKFSWLRFVILKSVSLKFSVFLMKNLFKKSKVFEVCGTSLQLKTIDKSVCNSMCGLNKTNLFIFEKVCAQNDHKHWLEITNKKALKKLRDSKQDIDDLWSGLEVEDFQPYSTNLNNDDKIFDNLVIQLENKLEESKQASQASNIAVVANSEVREADKKKVNSKKPSVSKTKTVTKKVIKKPSKTKSKTKSK